LLGHVGAIELRELILVVLEHHVLFFLSHAGHLCVLLQFIDTLTDTLADCELGACVISGLLAHASHHVIVVFVLILELGINLVSDCALLELNSTHSTLTLRVLQLLESLECALLKLELGLTHLSFTDQLDAQLSLTFR